MRGPESDGWREKSLTRGTLANINGRWPAQRSLSYRRQILALKPYFARHGSTGLMLDDRTTESYDKAAHSVAHVVIVLEQLAPVYGTERRRLHVSKYHGQAFNGGHQDFTFRRGGVAVFPRLVAGSSTAVLGPAGASKSTFTFLFVATTCKKGWKAAGKFVFERNSGCLSNEPKAWASVSHMRDHATGHDPIDHF